VSNEDIKLCGLATSSLSHTVANLHSSGTLWAIIGSISAKCPSGHDLKPSLPLPSTNEGSGDSDGDYDGSRSKPLRGTASHASPSSPERGRVTVKASIYGPSLESTNISNDHAEYGDDNSTTCTTGSGEGNRGGTVVTCDMCGRHITTKYYEGLKEKLHVREAKAAPQSPLLAEVRATDEDTGDNKEGHVGYDRYGRENGCYSCRACDYDLCSNCFEDGSTDHSSWFAKDPAAKKIYQDSDHYLSLMEVSPTCRLYCLVEIDMALASDKPVIFKVGSHLRSFPEERAAITAETKRKMRKSFVAAFSSFAASAVPPHRRRTPNRIGALLSTSREGVTVSFVADPHTAHTLLNLSSMVDVMESAYSLPDDFEREMAALGAGGVTRLNREVSTALFAAASEQSMGAVEAFVCGEPQWLRSLPQEQISQAFESASSGSRIDVMCELLASRHSDLGSTSYYLCRAAARGQIGAMMLLLDYGANGEEEVYGCTALGNATEHGQLDAAAVLLERGGVNVNQNPGGRGTALWWAASRGDADLVRLLLDHGADPAIASLGQTPLMVAEENRLMDHTSRIAGGLDDNSEEQEACDNGSARPPSVERRPETDDEARKYQVPSTRSNLSVHTRVGVANR
jgi:hypothetical protein